MHYVYSIVNYLSIYFDTYKMVKDCYSFDPEIEVVKSKG